MHDNYEYLFDAHYAVTSLRRQRIFRDRYNPIDWIDDENLIEHYRFDRQSIFEITENLNHLIDSSHRQHSIPSLLKVMLTVKYYANGIPTRLLTEHFGLSKSTMASVIKTMSTAICVKYSNLIRFSTSFIKYC